MLFALEKIEALAPDQAALTAASKLKASSWVALFKDNQSQFVWAECQGSGSTPYRVCIQVADMGYKCTCPSRKFPCKHSLGLMLTVAKPGQTLTDAAIPDWVTDWSSRRRGTVVQKTEGNEGQPKTGASLANALEAEPVKDEAAQAKADAKAAQQRERLKQQREQTIAAGLDEMDQWIFDRLNLGLAVFSKELVGPCRLLAQRLVDAKAQGLSNQVDSLPSTILNLPDSQRHSALIQTLGSWYLLGQAYRRQASLPEGLREDIRRMVGWSTERQALIDDERNHRCSTQWLVVHIQSEVQADKLRRIETWLIGLHNEQVVPAVLIDYVPVATGAHSSPYLAGELLDAQLVFYPSANPLRAVVEQRNSNDQNFNEQNLLSLQLIEQLPTVSIEQAKVHFAQLLAHQPWQHKWLYVLQAVDCVRLDTENSDLRLALVAKGQEPIFSSDHYFMLDSKYVTETLILASVEIQRVIGLWDGRVFEALMAQTSLGLWVRQ